MNCLRALLAVLLISICSESWAQKRVALVIGNSAYEYAPPLSNPRNDAADMAAKLQGLGFDVVRGEDLDLMGMRRTVRDFVRKLDGADMALLFYAGHGLQVNGNNYMAPVDAQLSAYNDLDFEAMPMDLILSAMERSTKVNIVFLDACRDNPLAENLARSMGTRSGSVGRGLARLGSGVGSLVAFATQPGNVALDGDGRNSPFTSGLLKHLGTPGQDITRDLVEVRRHVLDATSGKQVPWENSSLTGEVVLKPLPIEQTNPGPAPGASAGSPDNAVELAYWATIKDSTDKSFFEAYLQQYPNGAFIILAKLKIDAIKRLEDEKRLAETSQVERSANTEGETKAVDVARLEQPHPGSMSAGSPAYAGAVGERAPPELAMAIQKELARMGCLTGGADGKWGSGSQKALDAYGGLQGLKTSSLQPTSELLEELEATDHTVCLRPFNGRWKLTRRATNERCGWRELDREILITDGTISAELLDGKVSSDGVVSMNLNFIYRGKKGRNIVKAKIKGDHGTGNFVHVGGACAGVVVLDRM